MRHGCCCLIVKGNLKLFTLGGAMSLKKLNRKILLLVAGIILLAATPVTNLAQGRGRDRGDEKKSDRFVNRHDARDGRWDGRGPQSARGSDIGNVIRHRHDRLSNRDFNRDQRFRDRRIEVRHRDFDNNNLVRSQRLRNRHRHFERRN
jgi:hypothetical protein